ncbi:FAD/FMN-containing isoamyl alcohol oxidase-like protein MreA [Patellaria atrata CBS 101060]|uniref:FAD/FMN-containing isoamyl alcohol oxidase-like protein MreA n=1 Tax=Patellaria atrata CBS 101060 TaxID=1346257 RepID=A0A9P4SFY4_9PEZI|nr:FAD/FMN-containing isoamyl alcohol oxidase-like protein MreA [Patellaria atrata CBS 101060]
MRWSPSCVPLALALLHRVTCYNFQYERAQLSEADVAGNPDLAFGDARAPVNNAEECKAFPGDSKWPSKSRWEALDDSMGGALLPGVPPQAVCYPGEYFSSAKCNQVRVNSRNGNFFTDDPTLTMAQWATGNSCPVPTRTVPEDGVCSLNGYPAYVVNATSVKQIQLAVNFARNANVRLNIKNTGHDFLGRSTGGGSLSVWTHHLKDFEYLPNFSTGQYRGGAVKLGVGYMAYELYRLMETYNFTIPGPGGATVGLTGGFLQGGGHSAMSSLYGLMSDHVLSLEVVTADGRFVHVSPTENMDLFWALRGGGGSTFGIVTSVVLKAFPVIEITDYPLEFSTTTVSETVFWKGIDVFFSHVNRMCDAGGVGYDYIRTSGRNSFSFTLTASLPGMNAERSIEFMAPLHADLEEVGIKISIPRPSSFTNYGSFGRSRYGTAGGGGGSRFGSRLFPRENFANPNSTLFKNTIAAIRSFVEDGGYMFHSVNFGATNKIAGWPGTDSALNPAFRTAVAHATGFDTASYTGPPAEWAANHKRLDQFIQKWRDVTPTSGAYMNEADTEEPNFQQSFYGKNYARLLQIKKATDPWGVFYAITGVGSEEWEVRGSPGAPTQDGRLCKV